MISIRELHIGRNQTKKIKATHSCKNRSLKTTTTILIIALNQNVREGCSTFFKMSSNVQVRIKEIKSAVMLTFRKTLRMAHLDLNCNFRIMKKQKKKLHLIA